MPLALGARRSKPANTLQIARPQPATKGVKKPAGARGPPGPTAVARGGALYGLGTSETGPRGRTAAPRLTSPQKQKGQPDGPTCGIAARAPRPRRNHPTPTQQQPQRVADSRCSPASPARQPSSGPEPASVHDEDDRGGSEFLPRTAQADIGHAAYARPQVTWSSARRHPTVRRIGLPRRRAPRSVADRSTRASPPMVMSRGTA